MSTATMKRNAAPAAAITPFWAVLVLALGWLFNTLLMIVAELVRLDAEYLDERQIDAMCATCFACAKRSLQCAWQTVCAAIAWLGRLYAAVFVLAIMLLAEAASPVTTPLNAIVGELLAICCTRWQAYPRMSAIAPVHPMEDTTDEELAQPEMDPIEAIHTMAPIEHNTQPAPLPRRRLREPTILPRLQPVRMTPTGSSAAAAAIASSRQSTTQGERHLRAPAIFPHHRRLPISTSSTNTTAASTTSTTSTASSVQEPMPPTPPRLASVTNRPNTIARVSSPAATTTNPTTYRAKPKPSPPIVINRPLNYARVKPSKYMAYENSAAYKQRREEALQRLAARAAAK